MATDAKIKCIDLGEEGIIRYNDLTDIPVDERLEKLLNRFGQTISDLPELYGDESRESGVTGAIKWSRKTGGRVLAVENYICHLADVIDRMETALETAVRCIDCQYCENWSEEDCEPCGQGLEERFRISDDCLSDITDYLGDGYRVRD